MKIHTLNYSDASGLTVTGTLTINTDNNSSQANLSIVEVPQRQFTQSYQAPGIVSQLTGSTEPQYNYHFIFMDDIMIVTGGETLPAAPSPKLHIDTVNKLVTVIYDDSTQTDFQIADADWSESIVGQDTRYDFSYNQDGDTLSGHLLQGNNESKAEVEVQLGYASNASYTLPSQGNGLDNQIAYYHNDHLGTPQKLTDKDQTVVWEGYYSPFGDVTIATATIENNLRFAGQYFDDESGLHYNYFRYYDPSLSRYITSDPIGLEGGLNTYAYVENNPVNSIDPDGLKPCRVGSQWSWKELGCVPRNSGQGHRSNGSNSAYPSTSNCSCMTQCVQKHSKKTWACQLFRSKQICDQVLYIKCGKECKGKCNQMNQSSSQSIQSCSI